MTQLLCLVPFPRVINKNDRSSSAVKINDLAVILMLRSPGLMPMMTLPLTEPHPIISTSIKKERKSPPGVLTLTEPDGKQNDTAPLLDFLSWETVVPADRCGQPLPLRPRRSGQSRFLCFINSSSVKSRQLSQPQV